MNLIIMRTELKQLYRNKWLLVLSCLILALFVYAGWNGKKSTEQRDQSIKLAINEMKQQDKLLLARLDSLKKGYKLDLPSWQYPTQPTATGNYNPRIAAFPSANLSFIAIGQSDIFTHYVKPTINDDAISLSFTELSSPVRLLFGNFDLSFVLIYLLPLIVIAFCYNILSIEKESGSFKVVAANPVRIHQWLLQKTILRFLVMALIMMAGLTLSLITNGASLNYTAFKFYLAVMLYALFWFGLCFIVNLFGYSSEKNAVTLLGLWILLVLMVPSLINQLSASIYPMPSRTILINEVRKAQAAADKAQDKILDEFLRNHPEIVVSREAKEGTAYRWWQRYFASKEVVEKQMMPLLKKFDQKLVQQQQLERRLRFLSPSVMMQDVLNELAKTSTDHYRAYRQSVSRFTKKWKDFFIPMVYAEKEFTKEMVNKWPQFTFDESKITSRFIYNIAGLFLFSLIIVLIGFIMNLFKFYAL
ncbi:DUF3526 domain-containing protein [uncultured Microscilla sp.]|uniref:DUF3526 domain-containing protein n=1 Tax=uncultured Microscilla sp. TaxID=432653 RepID=UPI002638A5FE|nr:DUF3526 domain-containing protein [uncultured Microscilla sp.]